MAEKTVVGPARAIPPLMTIYGNSFFTDFDTEEPHIHAHGIVEEEVYQVLWRPGEDVQGSENSRIKMGRTSAGRCLKVIYVMDEDRSGLFVIAAYEIGGKEKKAFRRRQRRRCR
ncbi:MAG TPA: hypothetical protein VGI40_14705 [Pirellulaceae bacterium]|jgi:hypothetical protein